MVMSGLNPRDAMDKACAVMAQGQGLGAGGAQGHGGHMGGPGGVHGHAPPMAPHMMGGPQGEIRANRSHNNNNNYNNNYYYFNYY